MKKTEELLNKLKKKMKSSLTNEIRLISKDSETEKTKEKLPDVQNGSDQAMIDTIMSSVNAGFEQVDKRIE